MTRRYLLLIPVVVLIQLLYLAPRSPADFGTEDELIDAECVTGMCTGYIVDTFSCEWDPVNMNCLGGAGTCEWCEPAATSSYCRSKTGETCEFTTGSTACGTRYPGVCYWDVDRGACRCQAPEPLPPSTGSCNLKNCIDTAP